MVVTNLNIYMENNVKNYLSLLLMPLFLFISSNSYAKNNIELYFNGAPEKNVKTLPEEFNDACVGGICIPTTQFKVIDPRTGEFAGSLYVWAKNFIQDGTTLCFTELIEYDLKAGVIYTIGNPGGTCGSSLSTALVPPMFANDHIVAGGGAGTIVKGTEKYKNWKNGTYIDRVFVEISDQTNAITFYTGLFFNLMPPVNEN